MPPLQEYVIKLKTMILISFSKVSYIPLESISRKIRHYLKNQTNGIRAMRLSTHPHTEFLVLEAALEHPEKTLEKTAHDVLLQ